MLNPETQPPKVLIVEDDALVAMSIREVLSLIGVEVVWRC
jgi:CheY-like chemotaxis protein